MDILNLIKGKVQALQEKYPDKKLYITVNPTLNEYLVKHLGTEDYGIQLKTLYNCEYRVSPFMDGVNFIVSLFDYSLILWQWNSFNDEMYWLKELYDAFIDYKIEENDWWDNNNRTD